MPGLAVSSGSNAAKNTGYEEHRVRCTAAPDRAEESAAVGTADGIEHEIDLVCDFLGVGAEFTQERLRCTRGDCDDVGLLPLCELQSEVSHACRVHMIDVSRLVREVRGGRGDVLGIRVAFEAGKAEESEDFVSHGHCYMEHCSECHGWNMRADTRKNYDQLLTVARTVVTEQGAEASLRDVARRAGVVLGTLYRHFPTREALLEALLCAGFDELAARAAELETSSSPEEALVSWLRDFIESTHEYRGVVAPMMAAVEDRESALHASCAAMRAAGTRLLARAQFAGTARTDIDGTDLFALFGALAWLGDQPALDARADHLFGVVASAIVTR